MNQIPRWGSQNDGPKMVAWDIRSSSHSDYLIGYPFWKHCIPSNFYYHCLYYTWIYGRGYSAFSPLLVVQDQEGTRSDQFFLFTFFFFSTLQKWLGIRNIFYRKVQASRGLLIVRLKPWLGLPGLGWKNDLHAWFAKNQGNKDHADLK